MTARWVIPAFAAYGIELEYAIVGTSSLEVMPLASRLLDNPVIDMQPEFPSPMGWCNELAGHVAEIRNALPAPTMDGLADAFHKAIQSANRKLAADGARLMPTGMHPWMDPRRETTLGRGADDRIYHEYHRIFDCFRHGWSNIQSMHVNLPFAGDGEFERLHAAVRLVLPLVPALAASSPIADGRYSGSWDHRLAVYAANSSRFPSITGKVIPDTVATHAEYQHAVLQPMYDEIHAADPAGLLRYEWLNARGAIPRFDRSAIEIRLADTQECPAADIAIAGAIVALVKSLYEERTSSLSAQQSIATDQLATTLTRTVHMAEDATIDDCEYLGLLGQPLRTCRAGDLWRNLLAAETGPWRGHVEFILEHGTLASRILQAVGEDCSRPRLREVYGDLCECLARGDIFRP